MSQQPNIDILCKQTDCHLREPKNEGKHSSIAIEQFVLIVCKFHDRQTFLHFGKEEQMQRHRAWELYQKEDEVILKFKSKMLIVLDV